jgi:anti-sigma-K factor RskA
MMMDEDHNVLAAEYVLGTLDPEERQRAEALMRRDANFATLVRDWEQRLGELNATVPAIEPPPEIFERIKQRLPRVSATGQVIALDVMRGRLNRWRNFGTAMAALAAALVALLVTSLLRPDLMPARLRAKPQDIEVVRTIDKPADVAGRLVAVLQKDAASPAFILTVDIDKRTMTVRRVAAEEQAGKSYELWLVSKQFPKPRSLGIVGAQEFTSGAALATYQPDTINDATYAISLEPEGGSPTGEPTGPVLWGGKLIEAVPPAQRRP